MFFEEKTDEESENDDDSYSNIYSSDDCELENVILDKDQFEEIIDEKSDCENFSNINNAIHEYLRLLKWNDLKQSGKEKIELFLNSETCSKLTCRDLSSFLPCSKSTIQNLKSGKKSQSDNFASSKNGRPSKLNKLQIDEFINEATLKRKKFEPVSLKWAEDFIFKRFSITVSHSTIHRLFVSKGWKTRKVQKRHPKSEPKNKAKFISLFREYVFGYITHHKLEPKNIHIMDETAIYSNSTVPYTYTYPEDKEAYVLTCDNCVKDTFIATLTADGNGMGFYLPFKKEKYHIVNKRKVIDEKAVKGVGIREMLEWCNKFINYAQKGDMLIMDNLSAHHNKECINVLLEAGIKICFIPIRCADVLSALDNAFFAVFKWKLSHYRFDCPEDKKEIVFNVFDNIKHDIGIAMFKHCGYFDMFNDNYSIKYNPNLNYGLEPFSVSEIPNNYKLLKENKTCPFINPCLSCFLQLKTVVNEFINFNQINISYDLIKIKNGIKKILQAKKQSNSNKLTLLMNLNQDKTLFHVFRKLMDMFPQQILEKYFKIQIMSSELHYLKIYKYSGDMVASIFESLGVKEIQILPKILFIYNDSEESNTDFDDISIPCSKLNNNFNFNYTLVGIITIRNGKVYFIFHHYLSDLWYESCDKEIIILNESLVSYLKSNYSVIKLFLYVVDIFEEKIMIGEKDE